MWQIESLVRFICLCDSCYRLSAILKGKLKSIQHFLWMVLTTFLISLTCAGLEKKNTQIKVNENWDGCESGLLQTPLLVLLETRMTCIVFQIASRPLRPCIHIGCSPVACALVPLWPATQTMNLCFVQHYGYGRATNQSKSSLSVWQGTREQMHTPKKEQPMDAGPLWLLLF